MRIRFSHGRVLAAAGLGVAVLITSCSGPADPGRMAPNGAPSQGRSTALGEPVAVVPGLDAPWSVVFADGTTLVSERDSARILEVLDDGATRVVGTVEGVAGGGEGGLLGLAVDDGQRLYVYSTATDGNRIQRFALTGTPGGLGLGEATTLLDGIPSANIHNGGRLAFGPDGMLYATTGDAGRPDTAQDPASLGGKILRLTPDGDAPEGNPFPGSLTYSYGHRNPQGLAWSEDGTMFATEFGQNTWDELNVITPGTNYGWPAVEGMAGEEGFTDPVQQWDPGIASPSGMAYREGTLYLANLRGRVLRTVPVSDPGRAVDYFSGEYGRLRDVVVGPDGDLWLLTSNTDGRGDPSDQDDQLLRLPARAS
ncbi:PQQ-dependent sugar dehydrogenase [Arthrobacter pityocampae]|uniref:PQQ-dependent sugar dehydrogenase n=1 Tax=Arthrobacter pityocampae TaxID=547334 RepID=UPI003735BE23